MIRSAADQIAHSAQSRVKELVAFCFGKSNAYGGIRFDLSDEQFEGQYGVEMQPQVLINALEIIIEVCIAAVPENTKDVVVGHLAEICCDKFERFITQTTFCFSGAIKMEECVRGVINTLNKYSGTSIRSKFARIREITTVITDNTGTIATQMDQFNFLTAAEVAAFASLRDTHAV